MERWQSGRLRRSWKPLSWEAPGVRIPLSPQNGFKIPSEWASEKSLKADNRCKTLVLQRFFFVYSPSSRAPDLPLITTLRSYSATHSATKKTPHLSRAQRHSIDRLLRSKVSPILSLQKLLEWRLVQASWERFKETYFRNHIYKRLCTRQFWPMIQ